MLIGQFEIRILEKICFIRKTGQNFFDAGKVDVVHIIAYKCVLIENFEENPKIPVQRKKSKKNGKNTHTKMNKIHKNEKIHKTKMKKDPQKNKNPQKILKSMKKMKNTTKKKST